MAIRTMTLEEIKNLPPLTADEKNAIKNFDEKFDDMECPPLTDEQIKKLVPARLVHPEWYKVKKADVHLRIDADVLAAFKATGKGYQTRMNAVLRQAVTSGEVF